MNKNAVRLCRIACAIALFGGVTGPALAADTYDMVISRGRVIDPESGLDAVRDVAIAGGKIVAVSEQPLKGKKTIDAKNLVVAPGFIDLHSHAQELPSSRMQAMDGVTTGLELEAGVLPVSRYYAETEKEGRPINFGASASWAAARYAVFNSIEADKLSNELSDMFKKDNWVHDIADKTQQAKIVSMLDDGLKQGALGVGVLLAYAPGSGNKEYYEVNKLVAERQVISFTHVRYAAAIEPRSAFQAYEEVIATSAATGAHMHICHLNSTSGRDIALARNMIEAAQRRNLPITVEAYPYTAASTAIGADFFKDNWQERFGGARYEDFILDGKRLDQAQFEYLQKNKPETTIVFDYLAPNRNPKDAEYIDMSVLFPGGAIASDAGGWTVQGKPIVGDVWPVPKNAFSHPRSAGTFSRFLRMYTRETKKLTLLQAVEKASLIPAKLLEPIAPQMKNKGRIKTGADADIIVFDPQTVSDRATFEVPAQTSVGMQYVVVNGTPVVAKGELIRKALPGKPIRREID